MILKRIIFFTAMGLLLFIMPVFSQQGENSVFSQLGPPGSAVYTDLKAAIKDGDQVFKLDLTSQAIDPKLFLKIGKLTNLQAFALANNSLSELPPDLIMLKSLLYFS